MPPDVRITGAGVAGLCVATEICERGGTVSLLDLHAAPGAHACSWWAGGMLAPDCEAETAGRTVARLGREAADWWQSRTDSVRRKGSLVLALSRDTGELRRFARRTRNFDELDGEGIAALEPDLADRFRKGLIFRHEAHLAPRTALAALVKRLSERGVAIQVGDGPGTGADARGEAVDHGFAIDCRGLAARDVLPDLRGVKGEMLILRCPDVTLSRPVRLLHPRIPLYVVPRGDGVYMLGATMIESSERGRATARSVLEMLSAAYALHPAFGEAEILEIGVDARPAFPDNLPQIRRRDGVILVNGLYRHGYLLAPAVARMVADWVLEGRVPEMSNEAVPERRVD